MMSSPFCACAYIPFCGPTERNVNLIIQSIIFSLNTTWRAKVQPVLVAKAHQILLFQVAKIQRPNAKQAKQDSTKVALYEQFQRWKSLKDLLNLKTDKELAEILLDNYEKSAQKNPVCLR